MVKALLVYTAARIAIFAVLLALFWAVGLGSFPGIVFALLLSIPVSYFLLGKQRSDLTAAVIERQRAKTQLRARLRGDSDADTDALDREQDPS